MEYFFTFPNTSAVILAEQALQEQDISVKVRPVPNAIRAGCGLLLCIEEDKTTQARQILQQQKIELSAVYQLIDGVYIQVP